MAERSLRGSRLGALSMETDENVVPSERQITTYLCPQGHKIELPFSVEAEIPPVWECRCGEEAKLVGGGPEPEAKPVKPARTHWDMLLERRSIPELEELLEERLTLLRASRGEKPGKKKTA
ncbi:RNA polymerase binding protein RbpA [Knoellia remsis]|uniref:RNA polymerase-binding protein RbpA n=1 Tax=Knoellia remsis TaxID=407159 RepID=A0A2T0TSB7_9MICO|nr:RNA polymerase-binding protein RbpA [Knoellia remsis]PRY48612.1 RNA polymerase binding protein RbpA [Knoellia remsis]